MLELYGRRDDAILTGRRNDAMHGSLCQHLQVSSVQSWNKVCLKRGSETFEHTRIFTYLTCIDAISSGGIDVRHGLHSSIKLWEFI